jgi:hypothetical protein
MKVTMMMGIFHFIRIILHLMIFVDYLYHHASPNQKELAGFASSFAAENDSIIN